jgi:hypothetical protein
MDVTSRRGKEGKSTPYNKRESKDNKKAVASTEKSVSPVKKIAEKSKKMVGKPDVGGTKSKKAAIHMGNSKKMKDCY